MSQSHDSSAAFSYRHGTGGGLRAFPNLEGESYTAVLSRLHRWLKPQTYFEIGVQTGATLALAECAAIGVDPAFPLVKTPIDNKPSLQLYRMTSDAFFRQYNLTELFRGALDMAFLDGMHWYEYLLRDFINTERHCKPNAVVFLHDCLPIDEYVARRSQDDVRLREQTSQPTWWAGDVWKTVAILLKYRPDLRIVAFDAAPTGLVAITRLDPRSSLLADRYFDLMAEFSDYTLAQHGVAMRQQLRIIQTQNAKSWDSVSTLFWP